MDEPKSPLDFRLMSLKFKLRDFPLPRKEVLKEVAIEPGFAVLDYGCGPGGYVAPAAELVGKSGRIYALDINPLAIKMVRNLISKKHLTNVETILSDCKTGLPDSSIDVVLLYDTFHALSEPVKVLAELHRVLKPDGILSFNDHHMQDSEIITRLTEGGFFSLLKRGSRVNNFARVD
jgi:ubiquinone/menaquinone biosynthesis C-methylase UbiE